MSTTTTPVLVRPITDPKAREDRRRLAVQRVLEGETQTAVAVSLKVSIRSVQYWMRRYHNNAERGTPDRQTPRSPIQAFRRSGKARRHCSWLAKDPTEFGFRTSLWTAPRLVKLIRDKFAASPTIPTIFCTWLRNRGFTPQKPLEGRCSQRDEARIAVWPKQQWPSHPKRGPPKKPIWC